MSFCITSLHRGFARGRWGSAPKTQWAEPWAPAQQGGDAKCLLVVGRDPGACPQPGSSSEEWRTRPKQAQELTNAKGKLWGQARVGKSVWLSEWEEPSRLFRSWCAGEMGLHSSPWRKPPHISAGSHPSQAFLFPPAKWEKKRGTKKIVLSPEFWRADSARKKKKKGWRPLWLQRQPPSELWASSSPRMAL